VKWIFVFALTVLIGNISSDWTIQNSKLTYIVGSILSAAAHSSVIFIIGRTVSGIGAAGIITGAMRIISLAAPRRQRTFLEAAGAIVMG
jgi:MFS family permease